MVATRGTRVTGAEREQLMLVYVRRYEAGESIRSLAADSGRSYGFVQGLLKEAGVRPRPRGGATRGQAAENEREMRQERIDAERASNPDPAAIVQAAATGANRDLTEAPTTLTDTGLPTPPLGILARPKKKKDKKRGRKLARAQAGAARYPDAEAPASAPDDEDTKKKKKKKKKKDKKKAKKADKGQKAGKAKKSKKK